MYWKVMGGLLIGATLSTPSLSSNFLCRHSHRLSTQGCCKCILTVNSCSLCCLLLSVTASSSWLKRPMNRGFFNTLVQHQESVTHCMLSTVLQTVSLNSCLLSVSCLYRLGNLAFLYTYLRFGNIV